jgi:hypothetical protein
MSLINSRWNKPAALLLTLLVSHVAVASAYYQNKLVKDKDADINITIMRWGTPDQDVGLTGNKRDRIVGQIASAKYQNATLIFETNPVNNKKYQMIISTRVHAYKIPEYRAPYCTICLKGRNSAYSGGSNATGALASGGCFFEFDFPRDTAMGKFRLVDVRCSAGGSGSSLSTTAGESVTYFTSFNISPDLVRSPMKIPLAQKATLHETQFSLNLIDVPGSETKPDPVAPTAATAPAAVAPAADTPLDNAPPLEHPIRSELDQHTSKMIEQYRKEVNQLCISYISALSAIEDRAKQAADLKLVVDVKTEKDRFAESKSIPDTALASNAEIKKMQTLFQTKKQAMQKQLSEQLSKLAQSYLSGLKTLQDEYTKSGKIDDALKVNREIATVKANPNHIIPKTKTAP